ncbi:hypothetical protein JKF63_06422 [Porcisia hertigi]|uniref:Uncharacterized protein n=1 Tax=Porcisia hertigi TaxID=2761500 RepID=A0A836LK03_9TRYP|nr:hypothetical protein JKF63_06422 [Porcisia hertigi]
MPPSHVRKEEAELRQIAKHSRLARKEAQQRERKQRQRVQRAAAKNGDVAPAAEPAAASASATKKRRGAIILPGEVRELRQRLTGYGAADPTSVEVSTDRRKKTGAKKAARSPAKKSLGVAGANSNHNAAAAAASSSSSTLVPTFHEEVHFKKNMFFVDVVLHHVPHQKIDISETSAEQLVVDTCGHTKKYRLVLPYPKGMRCDAAAAVYEFENGVLHCRLPIVIGTIPADLEAENEKVAETIRQQKALRFRVTRDGDLTVRTRQALLAPTPAAQATLQKAKKAAAAATATATAQLGDDASSGREVIDAESQKEEEREGTAIPKSRKRTRDLGEEDGKVTQQGSMPASVNRVTGAAAVKAVTKEAAKKSKPDVFKAEHANAMKAAKAAAAKVHLSMHERVKLAKKVQASREERLQTRSVRKERKEEQKQKSFQRVLEEQKRQLLARASMWQPPAPRSAPKANASAKSVRFANA